MVKRVGVEAVHPSAVQSGRIMRGSLDGLYNNPTVAVATGHDVSGSVEPSPVTVVVAEPDVVVEEAPAASGEAPPQGEPKPVVETLPPGEYALPGGWALRYTAGQITFEPANPDSVSSSARAGTMEQRIAGQVRLVVSFAAVADDSTPERHVAQPASDEADMAGDAAEGEVSDGTT